jgi:hypothetical protein
MVTYGENMGKRTFRTKNLQGEMFFLKRAITFICNIPTTLAGTNAIYLKTKFSFFIYMANGYHYFQTQLFVILNTS